jgi:hypothetical protein
LLNIVRRWIRIRRAKREIAKLVKARLPTIRIFSTPGASLIDLERVDFVIATDTDEEAQALRDDYPNLYSQLCETMIRVGNPSAAVPLLRFPIESQQTVDREFGGSWHEAMGGR